MRLPFHAAAFAIACTTHRKFTEAAQAFDRAIEIDAQNPTAFTGRGLAYEKKGDRVRARADFNAALALPSKSEADQLAHNVARERLAAAPAAATAGPPVAAWLERNHARRASPTPPAQIYASATPLFATRQKCSARSTSRDNFTRGKR